MLCSFDGASLLVDSISGFFPVNFAKFFRTDIFVELIPRTEKVYERKYLEEQKNSIRSNGGMVEYQLK